MLYITGVPMPGALRLRALQPLVEGDGSCGLIYDLERAAVLEVPEDLQFHVASALETGDLDENLVGWLMNEDLLTAEGEAGWSGIADGTGPLEGWSLGSLYRIDDELHARIDARVENALEIIGFVLQQSAGSGRVKLHLKWAGSFPGCQTLERIVVEASRVAARLRQEIAFELTVEAGEVTPAVADLLAGSSIRVKLLCGSYPAPAGGFYSDRRGAAWSAEQAVSLLVGSLGERLTVHCVLDRGRLLDLWEWAKQAGIRHLDATILADDEVGEGRERPGRLREVRNDLMAVYEEMAGGLAALRLPVDFKPLTRIVGRLMRSEPLDRACGERGSFVGLVPMADVYPRSFLDGMDLRPAPDPWGEEDETELAGGNAGFSCRCCWARHVCSHSSYVASSQDGEDLREPSEDRCSLWRTEVEAALRFYHRLAHTDPLQVRRFFEDSFSAEGLELVRRDDLGHLRMPF